MRNMSEEPKVYFLSIYDLVAGCFIELLHRNKEPVVIYEAACKYGQMIGETLKKQGYAFWIRISRYDVWYMYDVYPRYFLPDDIHGDGVFHAGEGLTAEDYIKKFRGYLPLDVLLAAMDEKTVEMMILENEKMLKEKEIYEK